MESVKPRLRDILAHSHVAAVTIVVLLLSSFGSIVRGISKPLPEAADYIATAVAIMGPPTRGFTAMDRIILITAAAYLIDGCVALAAAWLLSRWVYGVGPFRSLGMCGTTITRKDDA